MKKLFYIFLILFHASFALADNVTLKSGLAKEGTLIEKNEEGIKIDEGDGKVICIPFRMMSESSRDSYQGMDNFEKTAGNQIIEHKESFALSQESEQLFQKGKEHFLKKELEEAKNVFHELIEKSPSFLDAYYALSEVYQALGDSEQTILYYKKAIEVDPANATSYIKLGSFYSMLKNYPDGKVYFEKALELDQDNAAANAGLGVMYLMNKDFSKAVSHLEKSIQSESNNLKDFNDLERITFANLVNALTSVGQISKATEIQEQAIAIDKTYTEGFLFLALYYYGDKKEFVKATQTLEQALQLNPSFIPAYILLSTWYAHEGITTKNKEKIEQAINYSKKALDVIQQNGGWPEQEVRIKQTLKNLESFAESL